MCGVIGVAIRDATKDDIELVYRLFTETEIRGKHATGMSFLSGNEIISFKFGIPAKEFLETICMGDIVSSDGTIFMIGHIRYSTSDLRYNQPFYNDTLSIVHNGVLSQEDQSRWKYQTETANDSELILRSYEHGQHPLEDFRPSSMGVCVLHPDQVLEWYRNEARPLWYTKIPRGVIVTSTQDIARRAGLEGSKKCEMYKVYSFKNELHVNGDYDDLAENVSDLQ